MFWVRGRLRSPIRLLGMVAGVVVFMLVSGACCCGGMQYGQLDSTPPTTALADFQNFPVDQVPRPIVRLNVGDLHPGFATEEQWEAFSCHRFEVKGSLPADGPSMATVSWSDGSNATYLAMTPQETVQAMRGGDTGLGDDYCLGRTPVGVSGMRPGSAVFQTDRGRARMTVWMVKLEGARGTGEYAYPAIPASALWNDRAKQADETATVSADGRSLTYYFIGTQADGRRGNTYNGLVAESTTAVELAVQRIPNPTSAPDGGPPVDHPRSVTVTLQTALGSRLVIDDFGFVVLVCSETMGPSC